MPSGVYPRTAKHNAAISAGKKGCKSWSKGLTKETDPRVASISAGRRNGKKNIKTQKKYPKKSAAMTNNPKVIAATKKYFREHPEARDRNSAISKKYWQDPVYVAKQIKARHTHPNKPEKFLSELFSRLFPGWKYTGSGDFMVGLCNPDFVNVNENKIIEFFGDYWHAGENPQDKINYYAKYGYQTLIIWERELKEVDRLVNKISDFNRWGKVEGRSRSLI